MARYFTHIRGFKPYEGERHSALYVVITPTRNFMVRTDGTEVPWDPGEAGLNFAERAVARGVWKEVPEEEALENWPAEGGLRFVVTRLGE